MTPDDAWAAYMEGQHNPPLFIIGGIRYYYQACCADVPGSHLTALTEPKLTAEYYARFTDRYAPPRMDHDT